jgi:hypothetical protein
MSYSGKVVVVSDILALISVGNAQADLMMKQI